ncbi:MAG: hypothetical protein HFJ12_07340 [Bacilli bacterium]|nr:hypothetical protein [Bacilli bacterium]
MYLRPRATYKFRKKRLKHKLEVLEEEKLNSMGIFTIDDYEVILDVDPTELDEELFKQESIKGDESLLLEDGGKHVR